MTSPISGLTCPRCRGPAVRVEQTGDLSCVRQCHEAPFARQKRIGLQALAGELAGALGAALPAEVGFALVVFDYGEKGSMAYAASAQRLDVVSMLRECADKIAHDGKGGRGAS